MDLGIFLRLQRSFLNDKDGAKIKKAYKLLQLRKTFVTKLLEKGIPIHTVRALADHSSISTTLNYYASVNIRKMKE